MVPPLPLRHEKQKTLFYGPNLPRVSNLVDSFFFGSKIIKKIAVFWPKLKKIRLIFFEKLTMLFQILPPKNHILGDLCVLRELFLSSERYKNISIKQCHNRPWKVCPLVKQCFFFWPYDRKVRRTRHH